jgi:hypothetical protein
MGHLEGEVGIMFHQFLSHVSLPRSFSSHFITLITKVPFPYGISNFQTISLVGSLYILRAKVLAGRLAFVMEKIILLNQAAFMKWRQLLDLWR